MAVRVVSPVVIGRSDELAALDAALAAAEGGLGTTVLVGGDAGVGKSRLVAEFAERAATRDATVLFGGCGPATSGVIPYAPVVELLNGLPDRRVVDELPPAVAGRLARLTPSGSADFDPEPPDQPMLFYALLALFERLAADRMLVVVAEDLQWADRSTRDLLAFLAGTARRCRLLLLLTYRSDELAASHPLRGLVAELVRAGADPIRLRPLGRRETAEQVASIRQAPVPDEVVDRVYARSEGNPFLTEELLAAGDGPLSEGLRDLLLVRVRQLRPTAQRLLHAIAVAGRWVEHQLLADVAGLPEDLLLEELRTVVDLQIVVADTDGYRFRHALLAEAVGGEPLPGERIRLHRACAQALQRRSPTRTAEIANHWLRARDAGRAYTACVAAGLTAERGWAFAEALIHFEHALDLSRDSEVAGVDCELDPVAVHQHAAEAASLVGDHERAITLLHAGLAALDPAGDPLRAGLLRERLARYLLYAGRHESQTVGAVRSAVELVPDRHTPERAQVLAGLAIALISATRHRAALAHVEAALRIARLARAPDEEAYALYTLGVCLTQTGDVDAGIASGRAALELARRLGRVEHVYSGYLNLTDTLIHAGRLAEAADLALEGAQSANRQGVRLTYGHFVLGNGLYALYLLGRWEEMQRLVVDELAVPAVGSASVERVNLLVPAAMLHTARGRFAEAEALMVEARRLFGQSGHVEIQSMIHLALAEIDLCRGRPVAAVATVDRALTALAETDHGDLLARAVALALRARADARALRAPRHRTDPATARVATAVERARVTARTPMARAHLAALEAELHRAGGRDDPDSWAQAAAEWDRLGCPMPRAYATWRRAEALLAHTGNRSEAAELLAAAHHDAASLGATPMCATIEGLARRCRVSLPEPARATGTPPHRLTERELDVLRLLSTGSTNRQVAGALFISEKTASIHVSRILAKLGAANRTEAGAIARRLDIIAEPG
jgi:DNA-binding CsgD family transcriptional regulator/tetratricopeptide (TPR) repeat protein